MTIETIELSNTGLPKGVTANYSEDFSGALTLRRDDELVAVGRIGDDKWAFIGAFSVYGREIYENWRKAQGIDLIDSAGPERSLDGHGRINDYPHTKDIQDIQPNGGHIEVSQGWRFSRSVVENLKGDGIRATKTDNIHLLDRKYDNPLMVTMTVCPLYELGKLSESHLMGSPAQLAKSRVAEKWKAGVNAVRSIQRTCAQRSQSVNVNLTFADLGVISRNPEGEDQEVLEHHFQVYEEAAREEFGEIGINFEIGRYSDIVPNHSRFVPASEQILFLSPEQIATEADGIVHRLSNAGIQFNPILIDVTSGVMTKRARKIIEGLMRIKGDPEQNGYSVELAEGLISQYGIFDAQTTRLESLNLFIERESAGLLLQLTDLFNHSSSPRVDILV